ncbi:Rieske 2Fe-2S domain-containing protein [Streptomyces sp. NPDC020412]|uniref:QcrA and Rieske domain-containing protein n=1 Tax=Streptomyces sp. NPDC020412 TaxID=3365073 RepID=UPI0037B1FD0C
MDARRRTVLAAGVTGAAGLAAGCDGGGGSAEQTGAPSPAASGSAGKQLTLKADVPVGGGKVFQAEKVVVVQPAAGEFKAYSAVCTHEGCLVNKVANGTIDCPCHGSEFHVGDGSVAHGPAARPLPPQQITVTADAILLH